MTREYVIQDPHEGYGSQFIRAMHGRFGWRAVCFFTSTRHLPEDPPELHDPELVAACYFVPPERTPAFCEHLKHHHHIAAVVPHNELAVKAAGEIEEALGLGIWPGEVMSRFRDKASLKAHLAAVDPAIRLNFARTVATPKDALAYARENQISRFVLKPNDGFGSINIGFFGGDVDSSLLEAHWALKPNTSWLMESYIEGDEYYCNGQVDADGGITIIDVGQRHVIVARDHGVICKRIDQILTTNAAFRQITDYTRRVISASGLCRSPFHAEFRVDSKGPILLECAARIIGASAANLRSDMHGPKFNLCELAAHYYGSAEPYGEIGLDWNYYNSQRLIDVRGICENPTRVYSLSGIKEVAAWPNYHSLVNKFYLGQNLQVTNNVANSPYSLILRVQDAVQVDTLEARVRATLRWNEAPISWMQRLALVQNWVGNRIRSFKKKWTRITRSPRLQKI